ncbi:MAG: protein kinase [Sandaracinaceae bacterium]|nr:protein kinase [Sandaracinaceae bacterium]
MKVCPRCSELYPDDAAHCPKDATPLRTVLDPLIGKTVGGRFRLIQRLGTGGMSSVYLARHVLIDRLMAIKTLRRDLARDPVQRDRFLREARAVNRINHDNIVEISDFGETDDGLVYLVMEYVPGEPLLKLLSDGPMAILRALDIAEQCANALARAHQMGVIHRDLKPENILIVQRKERRDFVKLLDFGIAKILDAPSLTGSQQIFGTPGYIAPEYIQSTDIDGRADLYSLGCILYELVTGALPFDYEYPGDLLVKHVTEPPVRPSLRHPDVDPSVEEFLLRCLEKNPENRFRDAFHFNAELRALRERLGPGDSWGGLDETRVPSDPVPRSGERAVPESILSSLARAIERAEDAEAARADQSGPRPMTAPYGVGAPRDTLPDGVPRPDLAPVVPIDDPDALHIPTPPALDGDLRPGAIEAGAPDEDQAPTPLQVNRDGLVGARRWRQRYDAIRQALDELEGEEPSPPEVEHSMAFAARTLEELEEAVAQSQAHQEAVEALTERARDFRSTLGRAMDQVAARLSEQRGQFDSLVARRNSLRARREVARVKLKRGVGSEGEADALLWELAAIEEELRAAGVECDALEARRVELAAELDAHNETFEAERAHLVRVLGAQMRQLEGTANALRRPLEDVEAHIRGAWPSRPPAPMPGTSSSA